VGTGAGARAGRLAQAESPVANATKERPARRVMTSRYREHFSFVNKPASKNDKVTVISSGQWSGWNDKRRTGEKPVRRMFACVRWRSEARG
jgi:hypothetical protein